jgi:hypothetical protein
MLQLVLPGCVHVREPPQQLKATDGCPTPSWPGMMSGIPRNRAAQMHWFASTVVDAGPSIQRM